MAHSISAEKVIGSWVVPLKGTLNRPIATVPPDALYKGKNAVVKDVSLQPREGMTLFAPTVLGARPTGAFNAEQLAGTWAQADFVQGDFVQSAISLPSSVLVVATTRKIWAFFAGVWNDITDTALSAGDANLARFTGIQLGSVIQILHTNGVDAPRQWDGVTATVSVIAGTPPKFADWTTVADRIVGLIPPYLVQWGEALSLATWPAGNVKAISDTMDRAIAIKNLGSLDFVIYKSQSIWQGISQPGQSSAAFFRFRLKGFFQGPAGPAAVVDANGVHFYMTKTGRIGMFNGNTFEWVAGGIWPLVRAEIDQSNAERTFGFYHPTLDQVWFGYPKTGDNGDCKGLAIIVLPNPDLGIETPIGFHGDTSVPISAGVDLRIGSLDAVAFGSTSQKSYRLGGSLDDTQPIIGFFQPGVVATPGVEAFRVEAMEVFCERGAGFGTLTLKPVASNMLSSPDGTLGSAITIDLTTTPVKEPKGTDVRGRFLGMRFDFTTPVTLRWLGARLAARQVEGQAQGMVR